MINIKGEIQIDLNAGKLWFNSEGGVCLVRIQGIPLDLINEPTTQKDRLIVDLNLKELIKHE